MKHLNGTQKEPFKGSAFQWRLSTAILLGGILFGLCGIAEAKKPIKPPPEPPPEPLSGVCYLRVDIDWGHGPDEIRRLNPDGSNMEVLFTVDPEAKGYDYQAMIPSEGTYGGSRLFACIKEGLDPITVDTTTNQYIPTGLVIVDEQNNEVCNVIPGDEGTYQMAVGSFTYGPLYQIPDSLMAWYHNDSKLAFTGRMIEEDPNAVDVPPGYDCVVSDWDTMGIYTVDLVINEDGTVSAGPPVLVGWTHTELVHPADASYPTPYFIISDFTVATDPADVDYLYCIKLTCPDEPACNDYSLYRGVLDDDGFTGMEFLSDIYMEGLQVDPSHSIVSGNLENRKIVYSDIDTGAVYPFEPPELRKDTIYWGAPFWSPDGENVLFGQLIRNPSLTTKTSQWVQATADIEDVTNVYKFANTERGGFIGWRADP